MLLPNELHLVRIFWYQLHASCCAGQQEFRNTEGAVIIIGSGIAGLSAAASLHRVSPSNTSPSKPAEASLLHIPSVSHSWVQLYIQLKARATDLQIWRSESLKGGGVYDKLVW